MGAAVHKPDVEKDASIETLRGLAIVMMVAGHVLGNDGDSGMRVADDSIARHVYDSTNYFRMPLFTAISGFVYAIRPVRAGKVIDFLKGKAHRILLPLLTVGALQGVLRSLVPGINEPRPIWDVWKVWVFGLDQFWFLPAIYLIFVLTALLDSRQLMRTRNQWLLVLLGAAVFQLVIPSPPQVLGIRGGIYLLPYFILGVGLARFQDDIRRFAIPIAITFVTGVVVHQAALLGYLDMQLRHPLTPLAVLVGLSGISLIFLLRRPVPALAWLGFYAFGIYLFHVWPAAATRIALGKAGIDFAPIVFVVALAMGLGAPIVIERVIMKHPLARKLLLGVKDKAPPKPGSIAPVTPARLSS